MRHHERVPGRIGGSADSAAPEPMPSRTPRRSPSSRPPPRPGFAPAAIGDTDMTEFETPPSPSRQAASPFASPPFGLPSPRSPLSGTASARCNAPERNAPENRISATRKPCAPSKPSSNGPRHSRHRASARTLRTQGDGALRRRSRLGLALRRVQAGIRSRDVNRGGRRLAGVAPRGTGSARPRPAGILSLARPPEYRLSARAPAGAGTFLRIPTHGSPRLAHATGHFGRRRMSVDRALARTSPPPSPRSKPG